MGPTVKTIPIVFKDTEDKVKVHFVVYIQNSETKWGKIQVFRFEIWLKSACRHQLPPEQ